MDKASARGEVQTLLGRHCRFPFYEPREFGKKGFYKTREEIEIDRLESDRILMAWPIAAASNQKTRNQQGA